MSLGKCVKNGFKGVISEPERTVGKKVKIKTRSPFIELGNYSLTPICKTTMSGDC